MNGLRKCDTYICMFIYTHIYIHIYITMECYPAMKNEISSFIGKWMQLKNIMLSEVSQVQKDKGYMFTLMCRRQIQIQIQTLSYIYIHMQNMSTGGEERRSQ
jgi:hypothetical protein